MLPLEIPEGINEKNACRVVINVPSFSTIDDGRAVYQKGRTLDWWVDVEEYSIIDMWKDVLEHFTWASNQEANFWYDNQNGQTTRLATDQELLKLLRASKMVKFIMTVDRCEHVELQMEDQIVGNEMQVVVSNEREALEVPCKVVAAEYEGQEWADEPEYGVTAAGPSRVEEEEEDHYMEPGFDPEGDDPIAADEEWRYFKTLDKEKSNAEKKGKVCEDTDPDVVPSDEATMSRDVVYVAHTSYDRDLRQNKRKGEAATSNPKNASKKSKKGEAATSNPKKAYKKSKKGGAASTSTTLVTEAPRTTSTSTSIAIQAPASPEVTTRSMTACISTPTKPPNTPVSPGPTTRRMTAQMDISPGGIARRVIIN
ncbi:unnamed protein product [Urochloa decumbens]|uniref:Uncharacterized protein n=1 Tax=Urochloa decumbens TaxID=240449 RepID=A0ABC9ESN8_9POAL